MRPSDTSNNLRLLCKEALCTTPSGLIVSRASIIPLAERLAKRSHHYPSLRVNAVQDRLIFWSVESRVELPWIEEEPTYLTHLDKTVFFPVGRSPNVPEKWTHMIINSLARQKGLKRPVLLLPSGDRLQAIGLGQNSCVVPAVNWKGFAHNDS